jgi:hypothetical protein
MHLHQAAVAAVLALHQRQEAAAARRRPPCAKNGTAVRCDVAIIVNSGVLLPPLRVGRVVMCCDALAQLVMQHAL